MNISTSTDASAPADAQWLAVPVFDDDTAPPASTRDTPLGSVLARLVEAKALGGGLGDVTPILGASDLGVEGVQAFGLGKREKFGPAMAFSAGVALAKRLAGKPRGKVAVLVPDEGDRPAIASALTEGLVVGTVGPDLRKSERGRQPFESLVLVAPGTDPAALQQAVRRGEVVGQAVNAARELVNTPPAEKTPAMLAAKVETLASEAGVKAEIWDEARIAAERFGGLLGVASGSANPPRFVVLEYRGGGDRQTIALVGKGVTFDSGGLSLKPSASMEDMKSDMTGSAVVAASIAGRGPAQASRSTSSATCP